MRRKKAILVGVTDDAEDGTQTAISLRSHQDVEKIKRVLLSASDFILSTQ